MKTLTKLLLLAALTTSANYTLAYTGTATVNARVYETQNRNVSGYHAISAMGSFDVYITQGSTESVKVEAPKDVIDRIVTQAEGGVLKIYTKNDNFNWGNWFAGNNKVIVRVTAKDLNSVSTSGSGDLYFKDGITATSLKVKTSGSGDVTGKVNVKTLESSIAGSGDIKLTGRADNSTVSVVGSGDFTAPTLLTVSTSVRVAGSGDARVNASQRIDASVAGSGDVHYTGTAKLVNSSTSGSGDVTRF